MDRKADILHTIKELIAKGDTKKALKKLRTISTGTNFHNEAIMQLAKYQAILAYERGGIIDRQLELTEHAKIVKSVLSIVEELEDDNSPANDKDIIRDSNISYAIDAISHSGQGDIISGNKIIGDPSITAEEKHMRSLTIVVDEIHKNFNTLAILINFIEQTVPKSFNEVDKRRVNETELAYQERAKQFHHQYRDFIFRILQEYKITNGVFTAHQIHLSFNIDENRLVSEIHDAQIACYESLELYYKGLDQLFETYYNDQAYTQTVKNYFREKTVSSKIYLLFGLLIRIKIESIPYTEEQIQTYLQTANISYIEKGDLLPSLSATQEYLLEKKKEVLNESISNKEHPNERQISHLVNDPYLLSLRKRLGLTEELSEAEAWALSRKEFDQEEKNPQKLIVMAIFAYLESDGALALKYLEKAQEHPSLPVKEQTFLDVSVLRLQEADLFEGSLGIIILRIWEGGSFSDAGLKLGDVIYMINHELVSDPIEIIARLGQINEKGSVILTYYDSKSTTHHTTIIKGGKPAGALITQVVIWSVMQI